MTTELIPALDPTPLPAPEGVFHALLILTFFLHALFVNLTLGGTLIAAVSQLLSRGREGEPGTVLAQRLMSINTFAISLAITTGVAPLLFVQVLYHRFFYSATILLGWAWFGFLFLLLMGYYAAYLYKFRGAPMRGAGGTVWLVLSALCFFLIAGIHVAVNLLHAQPELWASVAGNPWAILDDASFWPRLFHFVFAALGFSALVAAVWSAHRLAGEGDPDLERRIIGRAWFWAKISTLAQILDGFWLLAVLPRDVLEGLMRGGMTTLLPLGLSVLFALGLLSMLTTTPNPYDRPGLIRGVLALMTLTIAIMTITRHQTRDLYLAPFQGGVEPVVAPQWATLGLFALLLVAGLFTVAFMVSLVRRSPATEEDAA